MSYYIYVFVLAFVQTFVLLPFFSGYLYTPDLITIVILYTLLKNQKTDPKKILVPAFFVDLLYDSIGLNVSSKLLVLFVVHLVKKRYIISNRLSLLLLSALVLATEHTFKYILFRSKYYYPLEPITLTLCLGFEMMVIYILSGRIITK